MNQGRFLVGVVGFGIGGGGGEIFWTNSNWPQGPPNLQQQHVADLFPGGKAAGELCSPRTPF